VMSDDDGLFGPGSATWHLMGEPILWVAGIRALYLQALHPRTMCGTWQNSALVHRHETWARFVRTTEFVRIRTYGSTEEAERIGRSLRMSFNPPFPPGLVPLKLVIPALNTLAFASLPRWARKAVRGSGKRGHRPRNHRGTEGVLPGDAPGPGPAPFYTDRMAGQANRARVRAAAGQRYLAAR